MMTGLEIVDAHVHLWDTARFDLRWVAGTALDRAYLATDYANVVAPGATIAGYVCVEANVGPADAVAEAGWLLEQARLDPRLRGIVAGAPVELGAQALEIHLSQLNDAAGGLLKGVRRDLQGEAGTALTRRPDFLSGLRLLPSYQLTFDICVSHEQLPAVEEMVRRCPETTFVLDHLAKPAVASGNLDPWRGDIEALAGRANVHCKISGLVTESRSSSCKPDDLAPYLDHVLAAFGEDRILFGSDWPVLTESGSLGLWLQIVRDLTSVLGPEAQNKLFSRNAASLYRIDIGSPEVTSPEFV
jgi:L-fuconolactonase